MDHKKSEHKNFWPRGFFWPRGVHPEGGDSKPLWNRWYINSMIGCYTETENTPPGFLKAPRGVVSLGAGFPWSSLFYVSNCNCLGDLVGLPGFMSAHALWIRVLFAAAWWMKNTTQHNNPLSDRTNFLKQMHFSNEYNPSLRPLALNGRQSMVRIFRLFISVGTAVFCCCCFFMIFAVDFFNYLGGVL